MSHFISRKINLKILLDDDQDSIDFSFRTRYHPDRFSRFIFDLNFKKL